MANISILDKQLEDQLARLNSEITGDELKLEIDRAKAMASIGTVLVNSHKVKLDAISLAVKGQIYREDLTPLLGSTK